MLHFRLFTTGGFNSETAGRTTIRLKVPLKERDWGRGTFEKIVCLYQDYNAGNTQAR